MPDGYYMWTYDDWYYVMSEKLLVTIPEIPETKSSIGKILLTGGIVALGAYLLLKEK
jgi:hypothetical protein